MYSPRLSELPQPPNDKTGWPWTEESSLLPSQMADGSPWPRVTLVTPSFNQGSFLEETIRSVLLQGYPNLEYFILDGASTDNSVETIKKYSPWITYWISEPDGGQSEAINRGLEMGSGLFATWINSDDLLHKDALAKHATQIGFEGKVVYAGICLYLDEYGTTVRTHRGRVFSLEDLLHIRTVWRAGGNLVQPEVLFPRELALEVGGLNTNNHLTMDYELWGKFLLAGARFHYTEIPFGMFRRHPSQKTQDGLDQTQSLIDTAKNLLSLTDYFSETSRDEILADLDAYYAACQKGYWKSSGRLARIGLPPYIVKPLRNLRARLQKNG